MNNITAIMARCILIAPMLLATGCFRYPPAEKKLFSWSISSEQVTEIKRILRDNGYKKITKDDYQYEGAFVTQFFKEIDAYPVIKDSNVQILMSFKTDDLISGKYTNYGFSVFNLHHDDVKEINAEINRIENIIYLKLAGFGGTDNVVRGLRQ